LDDEQLDFKFLHKDDTAVVSVGGDIDIQTVPTLFAGLRRWSAPTHVVVDMEHASFIDSAGLSVLLLERQRLNDGGGSLTLRNVSKAIRRVLSVAGVDQIFAEHD
jgi:anti-anti-sigma factor